MFSDVIKSSLEKEVVGQTWAVDTVVRGVTRLVSGMTPWERTFCAYLFLGPTGTGKTHLIQTLARMLHGSEQRILVVDCSGPATGDPGMILATQLAPLYAASRSNSRSGPLQAPPLSIIQIECIERGPKETPKVLAAALKTGQVMLPDGWRGSLKNCMIFLTSGLCAREILEEAPRIGFTGPQENGENGETDKIYTLCQEQTEKAFGSELVGRLDGLVIFHRLQEEHLGEILDGRFARLKRWLAVHGFQSELQPAARAFLLEKGRGNLRFGARDLLRAHQKFVEFPVADLLVSGRIPAGGTVCVDLRDDEKHLHFTMEAHPAGLASQPFQREIPVA